MRRVKEVLSGFFILVFLSMQSSCRVDRIDGINRLNNKQFERKAEKKNYVILDVRTPAEYDSAHMSGSIQMNVLDSINFPLQLQTLDPNKKYLLYCRSGKRSMMASRALKKAGIKKVNDLEGGFKNWTGTTVTENKK